MGLDISIADLVNVRAAEDSIEVANDGLTEEDVITIEPTK